MKTSLNRPQGSMPLSPTVFHILLALGEGDRHGYSIMQEVTARSDGQVRLGPGTLYGAIKRMIQDGLIEESDERPDPELDDERRRYYRLTDLGQRAAAAEADRLAKLVRLARTKSLLKASRLA
jgi:DNA-binding PadR family transcriptional regulator